jgi:Domain of unknown function (DUF305)
VTGGSAARPTTNENEEEIPMAAPDRGRHEAHAGEGGSGQESAHHERRMYGRFGLMILTSTVVMFVLTYTNAYSWDHVRWSEERFYMALLMGAAMALIMLAFMRSMMYKDRTLNLVVVALALVLGGSALYLSRSQALVDDQAYMKGMIPHHSIAILTSERADIDDVRVRELADGIIAAQRREIKEMDWLVEDIEENGPATTEEQARERPVPDFEGEAAEPSRQAVILAAVLRLIGLDGQGVDERR